MFYFNTHSLLDRSMRSTALRAIKVSKKLGAVVFYDVNLPLPLWRSSEETKLFIQEAWNLADVVEVTKQELEFLCGIEPDEEFDTRNNAKSKFVHYGPEVVAPLWQAWRIPPLPLSLVICQLLEMASLQVQYYAHGYFR
jgi:sugar/nucleoside kinase (ribokinase family)